MRSPRRPLAVFTGGGTGGHLYPALAVADELRRLRPDAEVVFVGARRGIEARILPHRGERHQLVPVRSLDRRSPLGALWAIGALKWATTLVLLRYHRLRPHVVFATGGFASAPAALAALLLGVPLVVQEQNAFPGLVLRALSRWAAQVHIAFPEAARRLPRRARRRILESGNPVRPPRPGSRAAVRGALGVGADDRLVVVTGGSQGARALNEVVAEWAASGEAPARTVVLWSQGRANADAGRPEAGWIRAVPYIEDLPSAFAAAELAVGRAGAMTTAEIANAALPAVLVPLPTAAADHQRVNARAFEAAGAAVVLEESELTAGSLAAAVRELLADSARLESMGRAAAARARPGAGRRIARAVGSLLPPEGER